MLQQLTATQLAEWEAYNALEPIGEERADYRISFLSSLIVNLAIRALGKRGDKLTEVKDFVFEWDPEKHKPKQMNIDQFKAVFHEIASSTKTKQDNENKRRRRRPPRLKK